MSQYIFRVILVDGRIVEFPLDQPLTLTVKAGAVYAVVDTNTHQLVKDVLLKQEGESLLVEVEDTLLAQVDGFYVDNQLAFFDLGLQTSTGKPLLMTNNDAALESSDVVWEHSNDNSEAASNDGTSTWAALTVVGALAAIAVSQAASTSTSKISLYIPA